MNTKAQIEMLWARASNLRALARDARRDGDVEEAQRLQNLADRTEARADAMADEGSSLEAHRIQGFFSPILEARRRNGIG